MGASVTGMIMLLSRDFIRLILLANLVALPVIYFYARSWLNNFSFHIQIGWMMFVIPTMLLLVVTFFATSSQTIKTALVNPSRTLKYE
jgi:putative ABC transport system permease protein